MNVFDLRDALIDDYSEYISSFIQIRDQCIREYVDQNIDLNLLWPDPLIQLNLTFEPDCWIDKMIDRYKTIALLLMLSIGTP